MLDRVSVERVIAAPAERIFALLADPRRHHEFDGSGTVRDAVAGPERLHAGAQFGMRMQMGGPYEMTSTVVEFQEGRRIAWQPRPTQPLAARFVGGRIWRYELTPVEGGTLVRQTWDVSGERVPPTLWPLRSLTRRTMTRSLERLEEQVA